MAIAVRRGQVGSAAAVTERGTDDIGVEDAPPRLGVHVDQRGQRPDRRRVDEGVDPAEPLGRLLDGRSAGLGVGDVTGQGQRAGSGLLRRRLEPFQPPGEQRGLGASFGQAHPDATAQARSTRRRRPSSCQHPPLRGGDDARRIAELLVLGLRTGPIGPRSGRWDAPRRGPGRAAPPLRDGSAESVETASNRGCGPERRVVEVILSLVRTAFSATPGPAAGRTKER